MNKLLNNRYAVVDTETTGLLPGYHELIQIAILPIDEEFNIDAEPLVLRVKAEHPERMDEKALAVNGLNPNEGIDSFELYDAIHDWHPTGQIIPLGKNFPFDRDFIRCAIGTLLYNKKFHYAHRDLGPVARFLKDTGRLPTRDTKLATLVEYFGLGTQTHDALDDCKHTLEVYKRCMEMVR